MFPKLLATLATIALLAGCSHMDAAGEPKYADDADKNYSLGREALDDGRYLDASKYFEHVREKYPYSSQAALADLAVGDTYFAQEKYVEAIDAYSNFLKLRPNHPQADYAEFRIALSHYKDIPSDFVIFPPSNEKDQSSVRQAASTLTRFIEERPQSQYLPEAKKLLADVREKLARHELCVADFYMHREKWRAATGRLEGLMHDYSGTPADGEALIKLARAHLKLGEKDKAREALERLVRDHPTDPYRAEAESLLKSST